MKSAARLALVDRADADLSIVAQCRLLRVARSTLYWRPAPVSEVVPIYWAGNGLN